MAGAPSQKTATEFGSRMKNSRTLPYAWGTIGVGATVDETRRINSNLYPQRFVPSDNFDTDWMIRQQIAEPGSGMVSQARPMPWTETEIDYLKRKRDAEEYAAYNDWLTKRYNITDPANRELLKRAVPRYFEDRKSILQEQIALSAKYANLRLLGPENEEDLKLQYMVETGRVHLPQGPFHDPVKWMENEAGIPTYDGLNAEADRDHYAQRVSNLNKKVYEKGLFNPFSFLTPASAPYAPNANNMSDVVGDRRVRALGPAGAPVPQNENYVHQYRGESLGAASRAGGWTANTRGAATRSAYIAALPGVGRKETYQAAAAEPANARVYHNADREYGIFGENGAFQGANYNQQ